LTQADFGSELKILYWILEKTPCGNSALRDGVSTGLGYCELVLRVVLPLYGASLTMLDGRN